MMCWLSGKSCGSPGEIEGAVMVGSYLYGDEVTYICRQNYIMAEGNDTLRCQEDQTWSGVRPRCALRKTKLGGKLEMANNLLDIILVVFKCFLHLDLL